MTKYHVEYDIESYHSTGVEEIRSYLEDELAAENVEVTEIEPTVESGWYRQGSRKEVIYWTAEEIEGGWDSVQDFLDDHTRMKDPEVWTEPSLEKEYQDGYYRMSDGWQYRRIAGDWYLYLPSLDEWDRSSYDDSTIELDCAVDYLGTREP